MKSVLLIAGLVAGIPAAACLEAAENSAVGPDGKAAAVDSNYRGWKSLALRNGLVELQVLPEIGGRVVQFKLGAKEFLWVNPQLAGKVPLPSGLAADGGWFNVGGDKLWPAPQGWDNDQQWPGPPDAVLDGQPYALERVSGPPGEAAVRLTGRNDPRSGIRFSRVIRVAEGSTRVSFEATMTNIDAKPRRWGIWAHTQLDGATADRSAFNPLMNAWCALNPSSHFPGGYSVIFGAKDNPSFQPDAKRGLMRVQHQYQVGKIGLDSHAGWVATVDGAGGAVFVQRFVFEPKKEYPDGASVEFWTNGIGGIHAYNTDMRMADNPRENPYVFESEVLSPFADLKPGENYTWNYQWQATNIGGDFPVTACGDAGVVAVPLTIKRDSGKVAINGRFGVFAPGSLRATFSDVRRQPLRSVQLSDAVTPLKPVILDAVIPAPAEAASLRLVLVDTKGKAVGDLTQVEIPRTVSDGHKDGIGERRRR